MRRAASSPRFPAPSSTSGAVIPGADVKVKNNGTGAEVNAVTGSDGGFNVAVACRRHLFGDRLADGLQDRGPRIRDAERRRPRQRESDARGRRARGKRDRRRRQRASSCRRRSPSISTNLTGTQITSLPLSSRNALDSLTSLPGFNTSGTARNSTVSGLPRSAINITLDGMSVQDNYLKTTDGYFARLSPLLDSVEEVTVTTAGNTADATGQGAVQMRFVTKSGTNRWTRHGLRVPPARRAEREHLVPQPRPAARSGDRQSAEGQAEKLQPGRRAGRADPQEQGVLLLQLRRAARAELRARCSASSSRPKPSAGIFSYNVGGAVRQVNLLQLAAANGQLATPDPVVAKVLADIQASTQAERRRHRR